MESRVEIVPFSAKYSVAFKVLNEEWIVKYFKMEEMDHIVLSNPQEYIIDKGGYIAVALIAKEPVGVCALIPTKRNGFQFELGKMGVSPKAQGKGIGKLLGMHIIKKAKEMGGRKLYLESNRILIPAINLYRKLGFVEMVDIKSPYERSDIQMELVLTDI